MSEESDYEKMLEKGLSELPESTGKAERFEIPKVRGMLQGNKTVISNFAQIVSAFRRKPEHVMKFVLKELATPGVLNKGFLILGSKIPASRINEKLAAYAKKYVICSECGKPDTQLKKEGSYTFMRCQACGARHTIQ